MENILPHETVIKILNYYWAFDAYFWYKDNKQMYFPTVNWTKKEQEGRDSSKVKTINKIHIIPASFPELIETCSTDHKRRINFKSISSKWGAFEELPKTFHVPLHTNIWKVRHHVCNNLERKSKYYHKKKKMKT